MGKCTGSTQGPCPDNRSGTGVKKRIDGKYRCDHCNKTTSDNEDGSPPSEYCCNELLCFVRNNASVIPEDELSSICQNFYDQSEIDTAYDLLLQYYGGDDELPPRDELQTNASVMRNIVNTLKSANDRDIPKLVAANLCRIPTVSPDKIDVLSLFRDVSIMRNRLDNLSRRTAQEVNMVKKDVRLLYQRTEANHNGSNRQNDTGTPSMETTSTINTSMTRDPLTNKTSMTRDPLPSRDHDDVMEQNPRASSQTADRHSIVWSDDVVTESEPDHRDKNKQGKMDFPAKARKATRIIATGTKKAGLEASRYESTERLFLSFLSPETTEHQLQKYIRQHIGCDAICERLQHRFEEDFSSFKVTVRKRFVDNILKADVWPEKTVLDYYKSPLARRQGQRRYQNNNRRNRYRDNYYDNRYESNHQYGHYQERENDDFYDR